MAAQIYVNVNELRLSAVVRIAFRVGRVVRVLLATIRQTREIGVDPLIRGRQTYQLILLRQNSSTGMGNIIIFGDLWPIVQTLIYRIDQKRHSHVYGQTILNVPNAIKAVWVKVIVYQSELYSLYGKYIFQKKIW